MTRPRIVHPVSGDPFRQGLEAAKANARPGLILVATAVAILIAYHVLPPVTGVLNRLAEWKLRYGFAYSMCSTAVFGGILPILILQLRPSRRHRLALLHLPFFALFWATKGFEVDALYRLQAIMFGEAARIGTILPKVLVDQFVYVPLWAVPTMVLAYLWRDCGYNCRTLRRRLTGRWYRMTVLPLLLSNWGVWVPTVAVIYCLRLPLQLPVQNLILCLWALLVMFLTDPSGPGRSVRGRDRSGGHSGGRPGQVNEPPGGRPAVKNAMPAENSSDSGHGDPAAGIMSPASPRSSIG